jgi:hypothetical protein
VKDVYPFSGRTLLRYVRTQVLNHFAIQAFCTLWNINWIQLMFHKVDPVDVTRKHNICSSPRYVIGGWKIHYPLSERLKGTMTIGRFNLIHRSGLKPTVRIDICERTLSQKSVLNNFVFKAFCNLRRAKCFYSKMVKHYSLTR